MIKGKPLSSTQLMAIASINRIDEQRALKQAKDFLLPYLEATPNKRKRPSRNS